MGIETLPPVIQILIKEGFLKTSSSREVKSKLDDPGLIKDLNAQADWSCENFSYIEKQKEKFMGDFLLTTSQTMSPFSKSGKCQNTKCYDAFIDRFAKIVGLYVDKVILKDTFTQVFYEILRSDKTNFSDQFFIDFNNQIRALKKLVPLIDKGIICFANPLHAYCKVCYQKIENTVEMATSRLLTISSNNLDFHLTTDAGKSILIIKDRLYTNNEGHEIYHTLQIDELQSSDEIYKSFDIKNRIKRNRNIFKIVRDLLIDNLKRDVSDVLFDVTLSQMTHSIFSTGNRLENLYLSEIDNICPDINQIDIWEDSRAIDLPYVKELSIEEILILREEAQYSLPSFRHMVGQHLRGGRGYEDQQIFDVVHNLKEQLNEVHTEINSLSLAKEKKYRLGMSGLALSFVIYGLYSGQAPLISTSVAGLLATLAHLRTNEKECDKKNIQIQSKPAFTLFKAKAIFQRRK